MGFECKVKYFTFYTVPKKNTKKQKKTISRRVHYCKNLIFI